MHSDVTGTGAGQRTKVALLGAAVSGILFSAGLAVPLLGMVASYLAPAPIAYVRLRAGRSGALTALIIAALLTGISFKPTIAVWYLAQCGLIGLLLPDLLLRGSRTSSALLWSTAAATIASAAVTLALAAGAGQNVNTLAQKEITLALEQVIRFYEQQQGIAPHELETLKAGMQRIADLLLRIYPGLATLNLLAVSTATLLIFRRIAVSSGVALHSGLFRDFRAPERLIWVLIVAGFAMLAQSPLVTTPALNLLTLLVAIYFCQGLAVLITLARRSTFSGILLTVLAILLITQPYLAPLVIVLGIFDLWGDFRTPRITQDDNTKQDENL